jgi:hypothetical protein
MTHWWSADHRKIHVLYVSPPWARDRGQRFDAIDWARQMREARVASVELYCKDHHGVCYYPISAGMGLDYPRDVVGELYDAAKAEGLRFVAYYSVGYDAYALGLHPDWMQIDAEGQPFHYRPFFHACMNTPYGVFALRQLEELCRHRRFDAVWLDIVSFIYKTADHPGRHLGSPCYCLHCRRKYRQDTGGPLPVAPSLDERLAIYRWQVENLRGWLETAYATIRRATATHGQGDDVVITYNGAGGWHDPIDSASLTSIEAHAPEYLRQSFTARWARGKGKPFEVLTPGALPGARNGWNSWDLKPVEALAIEQGVVAAQGGSQVFGVVPYPDGGLDAAQLAGLGRVFQHTAQFERISHGATSVAQVAILLAVRPAEAPHLWTDALAGGLAWHAALVTGHVLFDVLPAARDLERYELVIVPDGVALTTETITALRRYVEAGGRLIVTGRSAFLDPAGRALGRTDLADLLGVECRVASEHVFGYLRSRDPALSAGLPDAPILVKRQPIECELAGATLLADLHLPETAYSDATTTLWGFPPPDPSAPLPGVTVHTVGRGQAAYVALPLQGRGFENLLVRTLGLNLVDRLLDRRWLTTDAAPGVEMVLNRTPAEHILHLVDHRAGDPTYGRPGAGWNPAGIQVALDQARVPFETARVVGFDAEVPVAVVGGRRVLTLPRFDVHLVVVLSGRGSGEAP